MAITIKDIAEQAQVSVSTVSRSLNDSSLVARRTKQKVLDIAESLGFEFNSSARGLSTKQIGTIGIILPEDYDQIHVHLYHSGLHNHLRRSLEREDMDLIVTFLQNRFTGVNNVRKLVRRRKVDGLILVIPYSDRETEEFLASEKTPYVYSHYPPAEPRSDIDWVYVDHEQGGMLVGQHFSDRGYERVIAFRNISGALEFDQRLRGFRAGLRMRGREIDVKEVSAESTFESGFEIATSRSLDICKADALFALNDLMALGLIHGLQSRGCRVPEDVAVVGYDDTALASRLRPLLSTVRQPSEEVAFLTCERLIRVIRDRHANRVHIPSQIALQPHLILRETCL
ncbi:MAG: LacI family DNA-binding transcriptional regulator [Spirochaetaceae bacterium]